MHPLGRILGRVAAVVGVVLAIGVILRLLLAIFVPILPATAMQTVTAAWDLFYGIISPALAPIIAIGILAALGWIISTRR